MQPEEAVAAMKEFIERVDHYRSRIHIWDTPDPEASRVGTKPLVLMDQAAEAGGATTPFKADAIKSIRSAAAAGREMLAWVEERETKWPWMRIHRDCPHRFNDQHSENIREVLEPLIEFYEAVTEPLVHEEPLLNREFQFREFMPIFEAHFLRGLNSQL